jgi:hypothetical protein
MDWHITLLSRLVFVLYGALLIVWLGGGRARVAARLAVMLAVLVVAPAFFAWLSPPAKPPIRSTFYSTVVPPAGAIHYAVTVAPEVIARLKGLVSRAGSVQFATPGIHSPYDVTVTDGERRPLAASSDGGMLLPSTVALSDIVSTLERTPELHLAIETRAEGNGGHPIGTALFGWQRRGLAGRTLTDGSGAAFASDFLPQFELRVLDERGRLQFVGF